MMYGEQRNLIIIHEEKAGVQLRIPIKTVGTTIANIHVGYCSCVRGTVSSSVPGRFLDGAHSEHVGDGRLLGDDDECAV